MPLRSRPRPWPRARNASAHILTELPREIHAVAQTADRLDYRRVGAQARQLAAKLEDVLVDRARLLVWRFLRERLQQIHAADDRAGAREQHLEDRVLH